MAKVKYYAKENSTIGTHSFYAVPIANGTQEFSEMCELAGNSIVVDVLFHIFRKMFIETGVDIDPSQPQQLTLF